VTIVSNSPFLSWSGRRSLSLFPKVNLQSIAGEQILFCQVQYEPGADVPAHRHADSEQVMWITGGSLKMTVGEVTQTVGEGDCIVINRGVEHSLQTDSGCTFLEAMSPVPRDHVADPERDLVLGAGGDSRYVEH
jgi:quercetin dioxygenase-like cupin family protein